MARKPAAKKTSKAKQQLDFEPLPIPEPFVVDIIATEDHKLRTLAQIKAELKNKDTHGGRFFDIAGTSENFIINRISVKAKAILSVENITLDVENLAEYEPYYIKKGDVLARLVVRY